ncbi:hypothetical protein ACTXT7_016537 [Hymenolepis weldensis]
MLTEDRLPLCETVHPQRLTFKLTKPCALSSLCNMPDDSSPSLTTFTTSYSPRQNQSLCPLLSPSLSEQSELGVNAAATPLTSPTFLPKNSHVCRKRCTNDAPPTAIPTQDVDITDMASEDNAYDTLKSALTSRLSDSQENEIALLLTSSATCDHMRRDQVRRHNSATVMDEMSSCETADTIQELHHQPHIHAVENPTPSLATLNHQTSSLNYWQYGNSTGSQVTVISHYAETFVLNPPVWSCKTSDITDGPNALQETIHDFLPHCATDTSKTLDKRKRRTSKSPTNGVPTENLPISHPTHAPQTPASTMEDQMVPTLPGPHKPLFLLPNSPTSPESSPERPGYKDQSYRDDSINLPKLQRGADAEKRDYNCIKISFTFSNTPTATNHCRLSTICELQFCTLHPPPPPPPTGPLYTDNPHAFTTSAQCSKGTPQSPTPAEQSSLQGTVNPTFLLSSTHAFSHLLWLTDFLPFSTSRMCTAANYLAPSTLCLPYNAQNGEHCWLCNAAKID